MASEQRFVIESGPLRMELDDALRVHVATLDREHALIGGAPVSLFELVRQSPEAVEPAGVLRSDDFDWKPEATGGDVARTWSGRSRDGHAEMRVELARQPDGGWTCTLHITSRGGVPIESATLTPFGAIPAERCDALRLAVPHNAGWIVPMARMQPGRRLVLNYPIHASMQWTDLLFGDIGAYFACHDRELYLKQLAIERGPAGASVVWRYSDLLIRRDETLTLPPFVIAGHAGGWFAAARRYGAWARTWMRDPDPPEWFARRPGWHWFGLKGQYREPAHVRYVDVADETRPLWSAIELSAQVAGWMRNGHDTNYPDYEAGGDLGTEEELVAAVAAVRREGRRLALYTNGRIIDPDSRFASKDGWQDDCVVLAPCARAAAEATSGTFTGEALKPELLCKRGRQSHAWDRGGTLAKEQYFSVVFAIGCPSSPRWRVHLIARLLRIVRAYRPDGMYIDQVCGCSSLPCYATTHGHERPALAWRGCLALLAELRRAVKDEQPDCYLATEGVGDVFGQYFDALQAHNDWTHQVLSIGIDTPELFRAAFPNRLVMIGPVMKGDTFYPRLAHVLGAGLDIAQTTLADGTDEYLALLRRGLALRERHDALIRGAEPERDVASATPGVRVFGLRRCMDSGETTLLINGAWMPDDDWLPAPATFEIMAPRGPEPDAIEYVHEDGRDEPARAEPDERGWRIRVPGARMFSLRLHWRAAGRR